MSQVDSMIVGVDPPKNPSIIDKKPFLKKYKNCIGANTEIIESKLFGGSQIARTKKKSIAAERQLADY